MSSCCCVSVIVFFVFKQKTAYEMRISDWSSDVCSSDLTSTHKRRVHIRGNTRADNLFEAGMLETTKDVPSSPPSMEVLRPYEGDKFSTAGQYLHGLLDRKSVV